MEATFESPGKGAFANHQPIIPREKKKVPQAGNSAFRHARLRRIWTRISVWNRQHLQTHLTPSQTWSPRRGGHPPTAVFSPKMKNTSKREKKQGTHRGPGAPRRAGSSHLQVTRIHLAERNYTDCVDDAEPRQVAIYNLIPVHDPRPVREFRCKV